eukprot:3763262-Rhodomonas_salina.5
MRHALVLLFCTRVPAKVLCGTDLLCAGTREGARDKGSYPQPSVAVDDGRAERSQALPLL